MYNEAMVENAAPVQLRQLGYQVLHGATIATDALIPEREDGSQTILTGRLRAAVAIFTAVRTAILKLQAPDFGAGGSGAADMDTAIGQIVNQAITADRVIDVYGFLEMGDDKLRNITVDLVQSVQNSVTIDWRNRGSVKAWMRSRLRRLLAIHAYPPDHQKQAIELVLDQAQLTAVNSGGS